MEEKFYVDTMLKFDEEKALLSEVYTPDNPVKIYLNEIKKYPLLSFEEEQKLGKEIKKGNKAAKKKLIESNLRLVTFVAKPYIGKSRLSYLDLIQEGNIGLVKAVDKFDYSRGYKFSTYATYWIRQSISRALVDQNKTIRIPAHMVEMSTKVNRAKAQFLQENGREPSEKELVQITGLSEKKVLEVLNMIKDPISLNTIIGNEEDETTLEELIPDTNQITPEKICLNNHLRKVLDELLETLDSREKEIIQLRFGLTVPSPYTLEEVGKKFNLTKERIRQIEQKALNKLRNPIRSNKLKEFCD